MSSRGEPEVARCEDYDSEESSVKPGTAKEARQKATGYRSAKTSDRYTAAYREGASSARYQSQASQRQLRDRAAMPPPPVPAQGSSRPATSHATTRTRPVTHYSDSQRSQDKASIRSKSTSRQRTGCRDPDCDHPPCVNARKIQRRNSVAYHHPMQAQYASQHTQHDASTPAHQQQVPEYRIKHTVVPPATQPAQPVQATPTPPVPTSNSQPRPSYAPTSRPRPVSVYGTAFPSIHNTAFAGPPPAQSAYQNIRYANWTTGYQQPPSYQQPTGSQQSGSYQQPTNYQQSASYQQRGSSYPQTAAYGYGPPSPVKHNYHQQSPVTSSPTSPHFATGPMLQRTLSARATNSGYEPARQPAPNAYYSARQPSVSTSQMYGTYRSPDNDYSGSSSDSSSDYSDEEYERDRRSRARHGRHRSSPVKRRPSIKQQYPSVPAAPIRSSRDSRSRDLRRESGLDDISSSENFDSDRTARAVVDRRTSYTGSSRSSRRPSISTTASSGRTKATTVSSGSGLASRFDGLTIERNGRNIEYMSKRDREAILRQRDNQEWVDQQKMENSAAYQERVRDGQMAPNVTHEDIREQQLGASRSNYTTQSRRSSRSISKRRNTDGSQIVIDGIKIQVEAGAHAEIRPGEDGRPTVTIASASGKNANYHSSSKSTKSRGGRSHGSSDIGSRRGETIPEEAVYEDPTG